ncbi:MAG TPA: hypothetical protein VEC16_02900 [Alphaproteobacteria bacterium]|nr:hypothetical protein [Alphaproteobacteria bacterium]
MKDLLSLTKRENCFYTVDGRTICTIKELHDYVMSCDPNAYAHHTSNGKNDFANWIHDVLMFHDLSKILFGTKNIDEAKIELKKFTETFHSTNKEISENMTFATVDEYKLKNIQELYYYLINCDDNNYIYHVNGGKNDFAKWIGDVWALPSLSQKMFMSNSKMELINILKDFLVNGQSNDASEYNKYQNEKVMNENTLEKAAPQQALPASEPVNQATSQPIATPSEIPQVPIQAKSEPFVAPATIHNTVNNKPVVGGLQNFDYMNKDSKEEPGVNGVNVVSNDGEEKIVLKTNILPEEEEPEQEKEHAPLFNESNFHSFTDEELEKFGKFSKPEKEAEEQSVKVEYLKNIYKELTNMIRDLRRAEKDALVAELMLRSVNPKIDYYALTKNIDDYNHIIRIMKDVQKEIEEAAVQQQHNLAEDIFKELRIQGIAMKKA